MLCVRAFTVADYPAVSAIYQQGIESGKATFQVATKSWEEWDSAMLLQCRLVAELAGNVVGWAALSAVSKRAVYAGVAEVSIYVANDAKQQGVGSALMSRLINDSETNGLWTLQAGIFSENNASIALHQKYGFKVLGIREKLGQLHGVWRDVAFMERRSKIVGQPAS
ncbi:N-acetyltransferase [Shewanella yunxiaonensis]|uniref:N-acetyltransferase n=1 Tax=Shewanella yunxiaonensis TaxID=2829809 RepID=A0ABX7YUB1_9GAMM|nr:GNAT family N-acetyltransferase [Shewanella yunxiaonensis]QUN06377.1 N-acetyltransferase [Shewanella yunxiaonensis]